MEESKTTKPFPAGHENGPDTTDRDFLAWLGLPGLDGGGDCFMVRQYGDMYGACKQQLFNVALIFGPMHDKSGFNDKWEYKSTAQAIAALAQWDGTGEPEGWIRNPKTGRRRPDGDKSREYVN
jgi:hypothetical protein